MTNKKLSRLIKSVLDIDIKKIGSIIVLILNISGTILSAQEIPKNLGIPERFDDYQTKGYMHEPKNIHTDDGLFLYVQAYSLDETKKVDVEEVYEILWSNESGSIVKTEPNPVYYNFDLDSSGEIENNEILIDPRRDGLNGNEEWAWKRMKDAWEKKYGVNKGKI